jgi:hypothetical protein
MSCPSPLLATRWKSALRLPSNVKAFNTLSLQKFDTLEVDEAVKNVSELLQDMREKRIVGRLWGQLTTHLPCLKREPWVPYLCTAIVRCVPLNPIVAFETALHFVLNVLGDWNFNLRRDLLSHRELIAEQFPDSDMDSVVVFLQVSLQSFFLTALERDCWLKLFDHIVCHPNPSGSLYAVAFSILRLVAPRNLNSIEQACDLMTKPKPTSLSMIVEASEKIIGSFRLPSVQLADLRGAEYYPRHLRELRSTNISSGTISKVSDSWSTVSSVQRFLDIQNRSSTNHLARLACQSSAMVILAEPKGAKLCLLETQVPLTVGAHRSIELDLPPADNPAGIVGVSSASDEPLPSGALDASSPRPEELPLDFKHACAWLVASRILSDASAPPSGPGSVAGPMSESHSRGTYTEGTVGPTNSSLPTVTVGKSGRSSQMSELPAIFDDEITDI